MPNTILSAVLAVLLAAGDLPARPVDHSVDAQRRSDRQVLADFQERVERYTALHRRIEKMAPPIVHANVIVDFIKGALP